MQNFFYLFYTRITWTSMSIEKVVFLNVNDICEVVLSVLVFNSTECVSKYILKFAHIHSLLRW